MHMFARLYRLGRKADYISISIDGFSGRDKAERDFVSGGYRRLCNDCCALKLEPLPDRYRHARNRYIVVRMQQDDSVGRSGRKLDVVKHRGRLQLYDTKPSLLMRALK